MALLVNRWGTQYIESKIWTSGTAIGRIKDLLNAYSKKDGTDGAIGQLMEDIITTIKGDQSIGRVMRWEFPARSAEKREELI